MQRFIHIPKNGGSAVTQWLRSNQIPFLIGKLNKGVGKHKKAIFWKDEPCEKFCVVRHPYSRTISYFNYISKIENWTSFENFVINKLHPQTFKIPSPWELQSTWLLDEQGNGLCKKIFFYETLEQELQSYFDCQIPLPQVNTTKDALISQQDLTRELKEIIYQHHKHDFEMFDYKF